jgi:hypothetical protein
MKRIGILFVLTVAALAIGCGSDDKPSPATVKTEEKPEPTVYKPPPPEHYDGTPYWLTRSNTWPTLLEFDLGSEVEYVHDSLSLRITGSAVQSFLSGPKGKEHPLTCSIELTVRPVPLKLVGRSFNVDSVVFFDPIKKIRLPALKMLSSERHTEKGVVRTRFTNNMAVVHSPDLTEGQPLEPGVYISAVGGKTIKVAMAPMSVKFLKEIKPDAIPTDSLKWGPS